MVKLKRVSRETQKEKQQKLLSFASNAAFNLTHVSTQTIDARQTQINTRSLNAEELTAVIDGAEHDLTIYCDKTGQPFDKINLDHWVKMHRIMGAEKAHERFRAIQSLKVCPWWIDTSPKMLDELMIDDPTGYFVYAASYISYGKRWSLSISESISYDDKLQIKMQWLENKKKCWKNIQDCDRSEVIEANHVMKFFNANFREYSKFSQRIKPIMMMNIGDTVSIQEWIDILRETISEILMREIRAKRLSPRPSASDIIELKNKYGVWQNFRLQKSGNLGETDYWNIRIEGVIEDEIRKGKLKSRGMVLLHNEMKPKKRKDIPFTGNVLKNPFANLNMKKVKEG